MIDEQGLSKGGFYYLYIETKFLTPIFNLFQTFIGYPYPYYFYYYSYHWLIYILILHSRIRWIAPHELYT